MAEKKAKIKLEQYLQQVGEMVGNQYGQSVRERFKDTQGTSELGMLVSPSKEEFEQLKRAVAIMTEKEKLQAESLTDEQLLKIAEDAKVDTGTFAIFINGYALALKQVTKQK